MSLIPSTRKAEEGRSLGSKLVWSTLQVPCQSELRDERLSVPPCSLLPTRKEIYKSPSIWQSSTSNGPQRQEPFYYWMAGMRWCFQWKYIASLPVPHLKCKSKGRKEDCWNLRPNLAYRVRLCLRKEEESGDGAPWPSACLVREPLGSICRATNNNKPKRDAGKCKKTEAER